MDRNTITGLILIFVIFIGFSLYNTSRTSKVIEKAVAVADAEYAKGDLEAARTEYINALRFKQNQPEVIAKLSEINLKLGIKPEAQKSDSSSLPQVKSEVPVLIKQGEQTDINQYGVFAQAAIGENDFVTLENNKVELKI